MPSAIQTITKTLFTISICITLSMVSQKTEKPYSNTLKKDFFTKDESLTPPTLVTPMFSSVRITRNRDQTISIAFIIKNQEIVLPLAHFSKILRVPCEGAYMYSDEWSFANLPKCLDSNPTYLTPLDNHLSFGTQFSNLWSSPSRYTKKGEMIVRDPFQMGLSEIKPIFKKWEVILSENVISLTRNKDHLDACLVYILYCLAIKKPFNLAYYIAKRMVGVIKNDKMMLPYGMLLNCLYRHVSIIQPCSLTDGHFLTPQRYASPH
ncbi:hypothetical protein Tco_1161595 [Tanacetum coccineum]